MTRWIVLFAFAALALRAAPMTKGERQRLLAHFELTGQELDYELAGLSTAQLEFRTAADAWSIRDVVEHLAIAEPQYWQKIQESLKMPLAEKASSVKDDAILWYGLDRTARSRTGEARVPKGQHASAAEALKAFHALRGTMTEYVRTTEDDLRGRRHKEGDIDLYQSLLMISSHAQRHLLQIREIKQSGGFPKR
ncbi:MAG: DinB family protein [Bryobacter sp.]|jgi:hypothetical protein|nr:DinB family protein [Bryobacter sp.]